MTTAEEDTYYNKLKEAEHHISVIQAQRLNDFSEQVELRRHMTRPDNLPRSAHVEIQGREKRME
eukprot:6771954-Pyramimonas_sp.AAC.1